MSTLVRCRIRRFVRSVCSFFFRLAYILPLYGVIFLSFFSLFVCFFACQFMKCNLCFANQSIQLPTSVTTAYLVSYCAFFFVFPSYILYISLANLLLAISVMLNDKKIIRQPIYPANNIGYYCVLCFINHLVC